MSHRLIDTTCSKLYVCCKTKYCRTWRMAFESLRLLKNRGVWCTRSKGYLYLTCTLFTDTRVSGLYGPSPTHLTQRHRLIGQLCVFRGRFVFFFRYLYIYYWVAYILKDLLKTNFCSVHHTADHSNIQKNYYDQIISIHCYYQVFSGLKNNILHE